MLRPIRSWIRYLVRRGHVESDLDLEIHSYAFFDSRAFIRSAYAGDRTDHLLEVADTHIAPRVASVQTASQRFANRELLTVTVNRATRTNHNDGLVVYHRA